MKPDGFHDKLLFEAGKELGRKRELDDVMLYLASLIDLTSDGDAVIHCNEVILSAIEAMSEGIHVR